VAGFCECGDEASGSDATGSVIRVWSVDVHMRRLAAK
jgi:hypothetical protein